MKLYKEEHLAIRELLWIINHWRGKYTVGWLSRSTGFKTLYQWIKSVESQLRLLSGIENFSSTVDERMAQAVFYCDSTGIHLIVNRDLEKRYFVIEIQGEAQVVYFDDIPISGYFCGVYKL